MKTELSKVVPLYAKVHGCRFQGSAERRVHGERRGHGYVLSHG